MPKLQRWHYAAAKGWGPPLSCERIKVAHVDPPVRQIQHFCRVIRGEEKPRITGADATRTLACVQGIQEAARTGRAVQLG